MASMNNRLLRPTAAGGFSNPTSIQGLSLWLDSDTATMGNTSSGTGGASNNGPVKYWGDKRGTAGLALSNSGADSVCPTLITSGTNSRPHLSFDGGDTLSLASFSSTAAATYFIAGRIGGGSQAFFQVGSLNSHHSMLTQSNNVIARRNNAAGTDATAAGNPYYGNFAIWTVELSNALSRWRVNGATGAEATGASSLTDATRSFLLGALASGTFLMNGTVSELVAYNGVLSAANRSAVERYLGVKYGITLAPQVSNADAQSWINRVYANGGTVSTSTAAAVNTLCSSIDAAGIRDRFYRLNLFCGTGLSAALVPLYRGPSLGGTQFGNATDINTNFVSGDYVEAGATGGLQGNGSTKHLATGLPMTFAESNRTHASSGFMPNTATAHTVLLGARFNLAGSYAHEVAGNASTFRTSVFSVGVSTSAFAPASGRNTLLQNWSGVGNTQNYYSRNTLLTGGTGGAYSATNATPFLVFAGDTNGTVSQRFNSNIDYYSLGLAFSDAQRNAYADAITDFRTALSRT